MPTFEDVTGSSGLSYTGRTFTGAWGDPEGDGEADLWISKHSSHALVKNAEDVSLYHNQGDGQFVNNTSAQVQYVQRDMHGAAWADFDNDGDADVLEVVGGSKLGGFILYENKGTSTEFHLEDATAAHGLVLPVNSVGRGVLWFDYDNDGLLDIWMGADQVSSGGTAGGKSTVYHQLPGGTFVDAGTDVNLNVTNATAPLLADLNVDGRPDLVLTNYGVFSRIYDVSQPQWTNIRGKIFSGLTIPTFNDVAIADFNNDGRPDIYISRSGIGSEVAQAGDSTVKFYIQEPPAGTENGFSLATAGTITLNFPQQDGTIRYNQIHVGADGHVPLTGTQTSRLVLSPDDPTNVGVATHNLTDRAVWIGYDPATQQWQFDVVGNCKVMRGAILTSSSPVSDLQTQGFPLDPVPAPGQLLLNTLTATGATRFIDVSSAWGVAAMQIAGNHVVAGDFDNDGFVDLYVDQAGEITNRPNVLLHNDGQGHFVMIPGGDGAPGPSGGTGGPVATVDLDHDGFLDLVSLNGGNEPPFQPTNNTGPVLLYHNLGLGGGNTNHWLEVKLHGGPSNADAIGAKVFVTAGGTTYTREWVGGQHIKAQDFPEVHVGLGQNTTIDSLVIQWPSGSRSTFDGTDIPVDHRLDVREGDAEPTVLGQLDHADGDTDVAQAGVTSAFDLAGSDAALDAHGNFAADGYAAAGSEVGDWLIA